MLQTDTNNPEFFTKFNNKNNRKWTELIQLLQVFIIGADYTLSGSTAWLYTLEMNKRGNSNNELLYGILNASYALPSIFLGGFLTNVYRNKRSRKSKSPFIMLGTQTIASVGSVFYTCSFSPFLVILGRTCQGFISFSLLSIHQRAKVSTTNTDGSSNIYNTTFYLQEVFFALGTMLSAVFLSFAANLHKFKLGKLTIDFGNISTVYIFLLTLITQIVTTGFIKKNLKPIAVHAFPWRNYGSIGKRFKQATCESYQKLQDNDVRKAQKLSHQDFRSRTSWLEKLIYICRQPNNRVPYVLFVTAHAQFSISLTMYILPIALVNELKLKHQYVGVPFGVFGASCLLTGCAVWLKIVSFKSKICQLIILLFPWFLISCIVVVNYIKSSELRLAHIISCFVITGSLQTMVHSQYNFMVNNSLMFLGFDKKMIDIYDYDRLHSILSNMATVAAAMLSGFAFKYYFWFSIILFVSNTAVILAFYYIRKKQTEIRHYRSNGWWDFSASVNPIGQKESFL